MKKSVLARMAVATGAVAIAISGATGTAAAQETAPAGSIDTASVEKAQRDAYGLFQNSLQIPLTSLALPFVGLSMVLCSPGPGGTSCA